MRTTHARCLLFVAPRVHRLMRVTLVMGAPQNVRHAGQHHVAGGRGLAGLQGPLPQVACSTHQQGGAFVMCGRPGPIGGECPVHCPEPHATLARTNRVCACLLQCRKCWSWSRQSASPRSRRCCTRTSKAKALNRRHAHPRPARLTVRRGSVGTSDWARAQLLAMGWRLARPAVACEHAP